MGIIKGKKYQLFQVTAAGADLLGEKFAKQYELKLHRFPANWNKYRKSAGYIRNDKD